MNLFLKIMIFVGFGILTTESNGAGVISNDVLTLDLIKLHTKGPKKGTVNDSCRRVVSKQKLGLFIANELSSVARIYDIVSQSDERVSTLFFTAEAHSGDVFPNIQCNLSFSGRAGKGYCTVILLQRCQSAEAVFGEEEIEISLSEVTGEGRTMVN